MDARDGDVPRLREGGTYLITGGRGRIGLCLAEYLAKTVKAKLVLVGRSFLPRREEWNEYVGENHSGLSAIIEKLRRMEEAGAEILNVSADVADETQMSHVITEAIHRFGDIHGVIHAAGILGPQANVLVQYVDPAEYSLHFRAKVHGLYVIEKLFRDRQLDFCVLTSSISSVLGGLGYSAYAAANLFMDAFAHNCNQLTDVPWFSVNYDGWNFEDKPQPVSGFGAALAKLALTPEEGSEAFKRVLSLGTPTQVIVSTGDLYARIDHSIKTGSMHGSVHAVEAESRAPAVFHSRPNLSTQYVAARDETEQIVAGVWSKLLGLEQVGIHDDFFELGGHSLLATQVISRIRDVLQVKITLQDVFESPTVASLADRIETILWAMQGPNSSEVTGDRREIEL